MKKYLPLGFLFLFILCGIIASIVVRNSIVRVDIHDYIDNSKYYVQTYSYKIENPEEEYLKQKQNSDIVVIGKVVDVSMYASCLAYKIEYKEDNEIKHVYILTSAEFYRDEGQDIIRSFSRNQNKHLFIGNEYHFFLTKYKYTEGYKPKNEIERNLYTYASNPYASMVSTRMNDKTVYASENDKYVNGDYIYEYNAMIDIDIFFSHDIAEEDINNYLSYRDIVWGIK